MSEAKPHGHSRRVALVGLGRLQLGLVAPLFSKMGFELVAVTLRGEGVAKRILDCGCFRVTTSVESGTYEEIRIAEVAILNEAERRHTELEKVARCEVINFGLGRTSGTIEEAGRLLLDILKLRIESGADNRLLVMCSDNPAGARFGVDAIRDNFMDRVANEADPKRRRICDHAGVHLRFVRSVADKICTHRFVPNDTSLPVKVVCEEYGCLTLDSAFDDYRGVRFDFPQGAVVVSDHISRERMYKLYMFSMAHAIACYVGFVSKSKPAIISEAMKLQEIHNLVGIALREVAEAISIIAPAQPRDWAAEHRTIRNRLVNEDIEDEIRRVARDVPRKLLPDDRLLGPLLLIYQTKFIVSEPLLTTVAAALVYASRYGDGVEQYEADIDTLELGEEIRGKGVGPVINRLLGGEPDKAALVYLRSCLFNRYKELDDALRDAGR